jgi:hypothetical protein
MPTKIPPCGFHPKVSILATALEKYLTQHPQIKHLSWYVASDKPGQEQRHDHNPIGWWTMQVVNGDTKSGFDYVSNSFVDAQFRFTSNNVNPNKALAFLETLNEVLLTTNCDVLSCAEIGQYVTSIRRSSITLPVVFRPKIERNSATAFYEFALKRDS